MENKTPMLQVVDLHKDYVVGSRFRGEKLVAHAVDGASFEVQRGDVIALVGESGCGKTSVARCIMHLATPTSGQIYFENKDVNRQNRQELKQYYRKVQMIFQDPYTSLNPRFTVSKILTEPLETHKIARRDKAVETATRLLEKVGLLPEHLGKFPHELSGGMRQRVAIARALTVNPEFLVLDEPTSALDLSMQAKTLNLLESIKTELSLTYLFVTHNMGVVAHMSNRIAVMYVGKIAEITQTEELFSNPLHPYTQGLLRSIPRLYSGLKEPPTVISGEVPSSFNPPTGCRFHPRCPHVMERCKTEEPKLREIKPNHHAACHLYN